MQKALSNKKDSSPKLSKKNLSMCYSVDRKIAEEQEMLCRKRTVQEKDSLEEKIQEKLTLYDSNLKKDQKEANMNFNTKNSMNNTISIEVANKPKDKYYNFNDFSQKSTKKLKRCTESPPNGITKLQKRFSENFVNYGPNLESFEITRKNSEPHIALDYL